MLKKILIIASMICVLVSSLVVVSFADSDSSVKYDYDNYVSIEFKNLGNSTADDIVVPVVSDPLDVFVEVNYTKNGERLTAYGAFSEVVVVNRTVTEQLVSISYEVINEEDSVFSVVFLYSVESGVLQNCGISILDTNEYITNMQVNSITYYYNGVLNVDSVNSDFVTVTKGLVEDPRSPSYLLSLLFTGFGASIGGLALGVKESLSNVIWVDPMATDKVLSPLVTFIFTIAGLSIAMTVFYLIFRLIRFGRQR